MRRRLLWGAVTLVFLAVTVTGLVFWANGYRLFVVHTGSMVPTYKPGDLVIDRPFTGQAAVGQVLTFHHSAAPDVVTHRVIGTSDGDLLTKGDANRSADSWQIPPQMVVGAVESSVPRLGFAVVFLKQPSGAGAVLVGLIGVVLLWQLFFPAEKPAGPQDPGGPRAGGPARSPESADRPATTGNRWRLVAASTLAVTVSKLTSASRGLVGRRGWWRDGARLHGRRSPRAT